MNFNLILIVPILLLSLQGCLSYSCYDWNDRKESFNAVSRVYRVTNDYLFSYTADILSQDDLILETVEQYALITESDLQQNTLTTDHPSDMPSFLTSQPHLYNFMFYPVAMRPISVQHANELKKSMQPITTDKIAATGYAPGFYEEKESLFLVTTGVSGLPRVFKVYVPHRKYSSGQRLATKTLLFPFAVAGDIITSPAQILIYFMAINSSFMM